MRSRSPIEMMVDRACGVPENWTPPRYVTLRCPVCPRTMRTVHVDTDPDGTEIVECKCPGCVKGDTDPEFVVRFFDAAGSEIKRN